MASPLPNITYPPVASGAAERLLWNYPGVAIEFTHSHKSTATTKINNGNVAPHHGFGHIAFNTDNLDQCKQHLKEKNVQFEDDVAFDPDGYYIKLCEVDSVPKNQFNLSQTMLRIKDPTKSLDFYVNKVGMKKVAESHDEEQRHSVYYLSSHVDDQSAKDWKESFHPCLKLTHFWDTEQSNKYHNGNTDPKGFGHIGFLVDNLDEMVPFWQQHHVTFHKVENQGFAFDPDGYWVEFIQRGTSFDTSADKTEKSKRLSVDKLWDKAKEIGWIS